MTKDEFHNALRILRSIDLYELQAVGLWAYDKNEANNLNMWERFQSNPYLFFTQCDDDTATKIWSVVEKRQTKD